MDDSLTLSSPSADRFI